MASAGLHGFKVYDAERYKRSDQTVFNKHPDNFQNQTQTVYNSYIFKYNFERVIGQMRIWKEVMEFFHP